MLPSLPSWSTIKLWLIGILTLGISVLFGLWKSSQAARVKETNQRIKLGKKARERADKALIDGLQREGKSKDAEVNPDTDIDRFY